MKPNSSQLFGNLFDDVHITAPRLLNFADDTAGRMNIAIYKKFRRQCTKVEK